MTEDPAHRFIELMGVIAQAEGSPRISGQLLGYLLIEGAPRDLLQITEALAISKASASTNARRLESRGILRRVSRVGARRDAWEVVDDSGACMLETLAQRFRRNAQEIGKVAHDLPDTMAAARGRVEHHAEFYRISAEFLDAWSGALCAPAPKQTDD